MSGGAYRYAYQSIEAMQEELTANERDKQYYTARDYHGQEALRRRFCRLLGLVAEACVQLAALHPPPVLDQVKEKYGGLRMYYHGGPALRRRWWWPALVLGGVAVGLWRCLRPGYRWPWRTFRASVWQATFWLHRDPAGGIVAKAEAESYRTCEVCGRPGQPNDGGWISTLCGECRRAQWRAR